MQTAIASGQIAGTPENRAEWHSRFERDPQDAAATQASLQPPDPQSLLDTHGIACSRSAKMGLVVVTGGQSFVRT